MHNLCDSMRQKGEKLTQVMRRLSLPNSTGQLSTEQTRSIYLVSVGVKAFCPDLDDTKS